MYIVAKLLTKIIKQDGFILISPSNEKFVIGNPLKKEPMEVKILKKNISLKLALYPEKYFPEGLIGGDIVINNGTIEDFITITMDNIGRGNISFINDYFSKLKSLVKMFFYYDSRLKSKKDVSYHYDNIHTQVFKWMLGENMSYSCAYWDKGGPDKQTLEDAQRAKLKFIQKKLMLTKSDTLLDIGSGFGSFIFSCSEDFDIPMRGCTLSSEQQKFSVEKQKKLNLGNSNIKFELKDFRDIKEKFSKVSSIGQFEHTNQKLYKSYFKKIYDLLTDAGIAVIHYIGSNTPPKGESEFIQRYIFPHGACPPLSKVIPAIEQSGLILSDCDTWRLHYKFTCAEWHKRFMSKKKEITKLMGEKFVTTFRIYLWGCSRAFLHDLQVYQLTLTKRIDTLPITKNYLFN